MTTLGPGPYSAAMAARIGKPAPPPVPEKPASGSDSQAALDALDQLQASLRARGVDLYLWEQEVLAGRREAGLERMARMRNAILETSGRCTALPDLDERTADEILGYDGRGGFAEGSQSERQAAPDHPPAVVHATRASTEEP